MDFPEATELKDRSGEAGYIDPKQQQVDDQVDSGASGATIGGEDINMPLGDGKLGKAETPPGTWVGGDTTSTG